LYIDYVELNWGLTVKVYDSSKVYTICEWMFYKTHGSLLVHSALSVVHSTWSTVGWTKCGETTSLTWSQWRRWRYLQRTLSYVTAIDVFSLCLEKVLPSLSMSVAYTNKKQVGKQVSKPESIMSEKTPSSHDNRYHFSGFFIALRVI